MNAKGVRNWLLVQPRPVALTLRCSDKVHELKVDPSQTWAHLAESVEAINPDIVEAYDPTGKLIRAARRDSLDATSDDDQTDTTKASATKMELDAETARFKIFSDHLAQAYQFATGVAFERMVDLFSAVNRRSESLEKSLEQTHRLLGKAYQEQVEQAFEHAEQSANDPVSGLVGAFLNGAAQGAIETTAKVKPPSPTNGKAKA